jgi:hypothetical protein
MDQSDKLKTKMKCKIYILEIITPNPLKIMPFGIIFKGFGVNFASMKFIPAKPAGRYLHKSAKKSATICLRCRFADRSARNNEKCNLYTQIQQSGQNYQKL